MIKLFARRRRARRLGCEFSRARNFRLPSKITIAGQETTFGISDQGGMRTAFIDVLLDDCYGLHYYRRNEINNVLDVGGNVGFFSLAARDAFPSAAIHCYEPNPIVLPYLVAHTNAASIRVFDEAVGATTGLVRLSGHDDSVQVRTQVDATGIIPQVAFRTAIERIGGHVDLVKLDCEGAEWEILKDGESWRNVDHLSMEYHLWHENHRHEDMNKLVAEIGFVIRRQIPVHNDCGIVWASRRT